MKKTLKLCGLYLLVTLTVALGVIFLVPMSVSANNNEDWDNDFVAPANDNHLLDIVGNLMNLHDANITADLAITTGGQALALNADVDLQATDGFAEVAVAGDLAVRVNDFATAVHLTYLDNTLYADWNQLHLSVSVPVLIDGLPTLLGWFGIEFTMPDLSDLDVNALLALLENYTETNNGNGYDVVLTVMGCAVQLTCDANFNLTRAVIPDLTIGDTTIAGDITLTTYDTALAIVTPEPVASYVDVPQLIKLFGDLVPTFNQPFMISGSATLFATADGNRQADNYLTADLGRLAVATKNGLLDQLAIEIGLDGAGELFTTTLNGRALDLGAHFNGNNDNGGVYVNFDGLKLFCAKADLADTYAALQNLLGLFVGEDILQYTNLFYFNDNNDMVFNTTMLNAIVSDLIGNLSANDIITLLDTYLPYLGGLTLTADNVLTLTLVNDLLTLTLEPTADGAYQLSVHSYLAEQNREIVATLTLQTVDAFTGEPTDTTGYLDVSDIDDLLNAINHTVQHQEFAFTGTVQVSIIGINIDVPVEILINNTDAERGLVVAVHLALPYSLLTSAILESAPDAAGKTQNGTRDVYLYYQQGYIYMYRTEQVKKTKNLFVTEYKGSYEKAVKLTMTEFMDDAMNWLLKWGFGFSDTIMKQITDAITSSNDNNAPLDYGNIIHGFTNTNGRYDIVLNLGEIAHNPDLKDFTVSVTTAPDANGQAMVTALGLNMQIDVGIKIVLQTKDNGLALTCGNGVADVTTATDWIDNYAFPDGETWQTIKGEWQAA